MSIRGFVGFWGNTQKNKISKSLFDKYKLAIYNGVSFFNERYTILFSSEYFVEQDQDKIIFKSGKLCAYDNSMVATIEISSTEIKINRDRWGTRMVYYIIDGENIYFASDVRFLLELPIDNIKYYNKESLLESATLGYIYNDEETLFYRIKQLPRNSWLRNNGTSFKVDRMIISADKDRFKSFESAYVVFEKFFEDSVYKTCQMKGNKAYLLSGGMDSTAIAIAASKLEKINTISFSSSNNSEDIYYAEKVAKQLKSKHIILSFNEDKVIYELPFFLNAIENVEMNGIFSPLGGFAYYLLCQDIRNQGYDIVFPGEGADEILGGYYWPLTHTFGFVDRLKEKTLGTNVFDRIVKLFPEVEERRIYREIAYYLLQGTALTNYHLSCVEHIAKTFNMFNYPVFMTPEIDSIIKDIPIDWLCDGEKTKIILRHYLEKNLICSDLHNLITRKKLAMPSVVTNNCYVQINTLAEKASKISNNPFKEVLGNKPLNIFMLDILHKYYTLNPMGSIDIDMWKEDMEKVYNNECIVHW